MGNKRRIKKTNTTNTTNFDGQIERDRAELEALLREVQAGDGQIQRMLDELQASDGKVQRMLDEMNRRDDTAAPSPFNIELHYDSKRHTQDTP